MRYIGHFLCVSYELHRDLRSYMGWEVHRGSGGEFLCEVWAWRPRRPWRTRPPDSRCLLSPKNCSQPHTAACCCYLLSRMNCTDWAKPAVQNYIVGVWGRPPFFYETSCR